MTMDDRSTCAESRTAGGSHAPADDPLILRIAEARARDRADRRERLYREGEAAMRRLEAWAREHGDTADIRAIAAHVEALGRAASLMRRACDDDPADDLTPDGGG